MIAFQEQFYHLLTLWQVLETIILPAFCLLFNLPLFLPKLALIAVLATVGFVAVGTIFSALTVNTKVLLLTQYEDRDCVLSGLKAGANGYIPKRATASDLVSAILVVCRGGCFLYPSVAKTMLDDYIQRIR